MCARAAIERRLEHPVAEKVENETAIESANKNAEALQADKALQEAVKPYGPVVEMRPTAELKPSSRKARLHPTKQVQQLAASISTFGFVVPIIVDEEGTILAGHGRYLAAQRLRRDEVPIVRVAHFTPERKRAFALADNRLAELSNWDEDILVVELNELSSLDLDFDVEVTGFETVDLDRLEARAKADKPEIVPPVDLEKPVVTQAGDLWQLGPHRLLCASALEEASYKRLLGDEHAELVFTDPPYNVVIDGHVSGLGSVKHAEFLMASGEMTEKEFTTFLHDSLKQMAAFSIDGAIHYICMDWRHVGELTIAARGIYSEQKNLIVWNKNNAGMGTFYRSKHELIFAYKVGTASHINNFGLGEGGRYRTNVWDYRGANTFRRDRMKDLIDHPTVKPLAMVVDALKDCSKKGGVVLDPFLGSGTTLLAAHRTRRLGRGIELDPRYVDVAIRRWQALSKQSAVLVKTGRSFDELEKLAANSVQPVLEAA
jgi:DNA modification methylase